MLCGGLSAGPAAAQGLFSGPVSVRAAAERSCGAFAGAGRGVVQRTVSSPSSGWVSARLDGPPAGDWDVAVFSSPGGRLVASSSSFGSAELAEGLVGRGERLTVRACRRSGRGSTARLAVSVLPVAPAKPEKVSLVNVITPNRARKKQLQRLGLDLTEHGGEDFVGVLVHGRDDARKLRQNKFSYQVEIPDLEALDRRDRARDRSFRAGTVRSALPSGRTGYRRLGDYGEDMKRLVRENPGLVKAVRLPHRTWEGRTVDGIEISENVGARDGKPVFLQMGLHHAREWPSGDHAMEWAFELVNGHRRGDARVRRLLRSTRTIVVPVVNPDGFNISREAGELQGGGGGRGAPNPGEEMEVPNIVAHPYEYRRKNCRLPSGEGGSCLQPALGLAALGVDPNRNYGAFWGGPGASDDPTNETYYGPGPFSEPETRNVQDLVSRRHVTTLITNHTFSNLILRPPGLASQGLAPDEGALKALGDSMAAENGYFSQFGYDLYDTTGTTEDWSYSATGGFGYTFEIGCTQPDFAARDCIEGHFHPPFQSVVNEYEGRSNVSDRGRDGKGNREAYFKALEHTSDLRGHSRIYGAAPGGTVLRLTKAFRTPTSQGTSFVDNLNTAMDAPPSDAYAWRINPSTRPLVVKDRGRPARGRPSPAQSFSGGPGESVPCGMAEGAPPSCYRDQPFTVPSGPGVDNASATIRIEWNTPASDYDMEIYRANAAGVATGQPIASSAQGPTDFEQAAIGPDPAPGRYVARVINFAAAEPYQGRVTFAGPTFQRAQVERWSTACESASGVPLSRGTLEIKRGEQRRLDFANCFRALGRAFRTGRGCDSPTGRAARTSFDRARLGRSRSRHLRAFRIGRRTRSSVDRFCLSDRGILRIGYPSRRLRRGLSRSDRRRYRADKAILILASSKRYRLRGVRVGMTRNDLLRRARPSRGIRVGRNVWYLARGSRARIVYKFARGRVREVGIADRRLTGSRRGAARFLKSFR
jgi:hypothetical protein